MMHDDGQHVEGLEEADVVLVGVSRTSKTTTHAGHHHDAEAGRPDHRIPYFCAARSAASASEPAPWPRSAVIISAPAAPLPASSMIPTTAVAGAAITTSSGTNCNLSRLPTV